MPQGKKNPEATRLAILDAAEQVFLERGVQRASLEEIARVAGVTRGAVYWHFANKAKVFNAMVDRVEMQPHQLFARLPAEAGRNSIDRVRRMCVDALMTIATDERTRRVFTISLLSLEHIHGIDEIRDHEIKLRAEGRRTVTRYFQDARDQGLLRESLAPAMCASVLESYMTGLLFIWLRNPDQFDMKADAPRLVDALFQGMVHDTP